MIGDHTTYPHDVSFRCDEGFILMGPKVRSCTTEGTWNGTPAFCEGAKTVSLEILITYQSIQSDRHEIVVVVKAVHLMSLLLVQYRYKPI